ncbi:MAG: SsrA-binding protein [Proteobacteria bacterium]|nr:SsrA-binding protein [Pseudomonadota bacterium]
MSNKKSKNPSGNVIAVNRRARHDYFIENTFEAGLALLGWEVKSMRDGRAQLAEAYVNLRKGEAWLVGSQITPYRPAKSSQINYNPSQKRKLLLHKKEIDSLLGKILRMTLDGDPILTNPFYEDDDTTNAADYVWASGFRNPFGLKILEGRVFVADNGPAVDRFLRVTEGTNYLWDGSDFSIGTNADVLSLTDQ